MLFSSAPPRRQIALSQGGFAWHERVMKISRFTTAAIAALVLTASMSRAESPPVAPATIPSPGEIVAAAPTSDWTAIAASDLLVMDLAADAKGKPRRVVIQLMPAPFSQGWVGNIRKLAAAKFWDGTSINRVQDNYVTQWGDATEKKALPEGLHNVGEQEYVTEDLIAVPDLRGRPRLDYNFLASMIRNAMIAANGSWQLSDELTAALQSGKSQPTEWPEPAVGDAYSDIASLVLGWPIAGSEGKSEPSRFWPAHCYGMVGVGRNYSPDTGTGAELYTVIGHAPRHLDRNIALVGRIVEGMEHMSSLPRGTGDLGFYKTPEERTGILSIRLGGEVPQLPAYEYLSTESESFAKYADARANRRDPFFIKPAGGADICNIPVPVRRKG
jgi:cyclophilin family peptidyl-prolyl cis-trans isomerase